MLSVTEENYLKAIYQLNIEGKVSTNAVSKRLLTKPSSVTDMLKKLSQKQLIEYVKYHGVSLTQKGEEEALNLVRKHRLWEFFLVEKLGFHCDEIHEIAEQLEHINSVKLTNKLEEHLKFPTHDPHGAPIPDKKGQILSDGYSFLSQSRQGSEPLAEGIKENSNKPSTSSNTSTFMEGSKIKTEVSLPAKSSLEVKIDDKEEVLISGSLAKQLVILQRQRT
jgi:DtxR family transcriptional regulator, Mn-dependent transcriptional regulator